MKSPTRNGQKKEYTQEDMTKERNYWFNRGIEQGKDEIRKSLIDLLKLDDRYEIAGEDY